MTVGSEFEGVKPTPPGVGQRLEVRGSKKEARGFDPPPPRQIEPCPYLTIPPSIFFRFVSFCRIYVFLLPPILTMMHLCITQYTYTGRLCPEVQVRELYVGGKVRMAYS